MAKPTLFSTSQTRHRHAVKPALLAYWLPQTGYLRFAFAVSILVHGILLGIHFTSNKPTRTEHNRLELEVLMVTSHTDTPPPKQELLSQQNSDGGGNETSQDVNRSPLNIDNPVDGVQSEIAQAMQKQAELDAERLQVLAQLNEQIIQIRQSLVHETNPQIIEQKTKRAQQLAAMSELLSKNNRRPRTHFFAPSSSEYRFAEYVATWQKRVESVGTKYYPEDAKGKLYGSLRMTVYINADGTIQAIEIDTPAKNPVLTEAAQRIVKLAAPFNAFPPTMAKDTDILAITRTWNFSNNKLTAGAN